MPTYEYECKNCGHRFEQMQKISADPLVDCPDCGKPELRRLVNAAAFHLKGSGWYKTDYAPKSASSTSSNGTAAETKKEGGAKEAKDAPAKDSATKESAPASSSTSKD